MTRSLPLAATIGGKIRAARRRAKLTARALADRAELHEVTIYDLEAGRDLPDVATLLALAAALDTTLDALAGRRSPAEPPRLGKGEHPFTAFARMNDESQAAFARRAGVTPQQLADWKSRRKGISLVNLLALASAATCPAQWLAEQVA